MEYQGTESVSISLKPDFHGTHFLIYSLRLIPLYPSAGQIFKNENYSRYLRVNCIFVNHVLTPRSYSLLLSFVDLLLL